jgi:hypothetical protein
MRALYRLRTATAAIVTRYGNRDLITIRSGAIIAVEEPLERDIVKVEWDGETVWMFTRDIWEHGELVSDTAAASAKL